MALASLQDIEKNFGRRVMFDKLGFSIDRGERIGLIGDNGSGKTTLFRVLTGQLAVDAGTVGIAEGAKIGHLEQDPVFDVANTVMDEAELAFATLHDLSHRLRELEHEMAHLAGDELEKILHRYQKTQEDFELAGGYAWRHKLEAMLEGVGLPPETWEQNVGTLSGGQRSRLALAKLLTGQCDLLLLDEPTNHLDLTAIAWLEEYLANFPGAVLLVSHDRYLLDRLATRIVWLTGAKLKSYPGNYSAYVEQRKLQELSQQRAYEEQQADIAKQAEFIRRFGAGQRSKEAKGRDKRLQRLLASDELIQSVETASKIRVSMNSDLRAGDRVLRVKELSKRYGDKALWTDVKLDVTRGERIGIIGPNGSGKTTLLEVLLGKRELDGGEVRWGASLKIGYYDQRLGEFNPDHTVSDEVRSGRDVNDAEVRAVLALMLFRNEDVDKPIRMLSGGERARVAIAQLLIDRPNVLVMDEPTNHLDINSCEALERALNDFDGTVICVSHDRYFLDKVAERLLVLEPPEIVSFDGNYTAWARDGAKKKAEVAAAAKEAEAQAAREARAARKSESGKKKSEKPGGDRAGNQGGDRGSAQTGDRQGSQARNSQNPYSRPFGRLGVEELEKQIAATEKEIGRCQESMSNPKLARDPQRLRQISQEHDSLTKKLRELEKEYFARSA
jgi:ATP-binding cassette subfamily F protein 3